MRVRVNRKRLLKQLHPPFVLVATLEYIVTFF